MRKIRKSIGVVLMTVLITMLFAGCDLDPNATNETLSNNTKSATVASAGVIENQPAPTDLDYSLERYNLIRRAYWVNGQREKANSLVCELDKPLGYVVLFSASGAIIGNFIVDGKVSSLGSYLFPAYIDATSDGVVGKTQKISSAYSVTSSVFSVEVPGIDGAYGSNVTGIFFFTTDGKYIEWTGDFLYSDIPFEVSNPILKVGK